MCLFGKGAYRDILSLGFHACAGLLYLFVFCATSRLDILTCRLKGYMSLPCKLDNGERLPGCHQVVIDLFHALLLRHFGMLLQVLVHVSIGGMCTYVSLFAQLHASDFFTSIQECCTRLVKSLLLCGSQWSVWQRTHAKSGTYGR